MMRPLEYPKASSVKPLLQRMAEEKRFQMERGSIGGSYFMVQLPDGSMEKRMKMPINIDPGVHSSFNLDQLVPGKSFALFGVFILSFIQISWCWNLCTYFYSNYCRYSFDPCTYGPNLANDLGGEGAGAVIVRRYVSERERGFEKCYK